MFHLKPYQEKAVGKLTEGALELLHESQGSNLRRVPLLLRAPTGSGKMVTMAAFLEQFTAAVEREDMLKHKRYAFIWIAPMKLHLQSYERLKAFYAETRSLRPVLFNDVAGKTIAPDEIVFLNWEFINSDGNILWRENEQRRTIPNLVQRTRAAGREIIVIIDEYHLFVHKGERSEIVLKTLDARLEIAVTATPPPDFAAKTANQGRIVKINRHDVVQAAMIKCGVRLNPDLDPSLQDGRTLNSVLLDTAMKRRSALAEVYRALGVRVNPLLLIQLPNDKQAVSVEDRAMKEMILKRLEERHHCTTSNGRVAVWLSDGADKINLDGLEEPFCTTDVFLFKQAIAQGWDCPRAAVLLIYRELRQETFALQTVGRILRMPEQRHYGSVQREELDYGYVYTDLLREFITIVPEDEDYIVQNHAQRRAAYADVELTLSANHIITSIDRNRLGAKYRKALYRVAEEYFDISMDFSVFDAANAAKKAGITDAVIDNAESQQIRNVKALQAKMIRTDVKNIEVAVAVNIAFDVQQSYDEGKRIEVDALHKARFARTRSELEQSFRRFCAQHCGNYAKADSTEVMSFALKKLLFEYCGFGDLDAMKIILETNNSLHFTEVLAQSLTEYARLQEEGAKKCKQTVTSSQWSVPKERSYNDKIYAHQENIAYHILEPFYERNDVSRPEKAFARFLEANANDSPHGVRWWYKNGDSGREHFAIEYAQANGTKSLFFPDFIVQLNNDVLCVFDTKTPDSDPAAPQKYNALLAWSKERTAHGKLTFGSIIVPHLVGETITWKYCSASITDTNDLSTWQTLIPSNIHERI